MFTIQTQRELRVSEPEAVAVDLVPLSELTKVRQGVRTAKQMDAQAKETPKAAEVPRKEAPKPTPVATPKPPDPPKPEPPKEEVKEAPKPEPPKPEPPKEVAKVEPPKPATDPIAEKLAAERPDPAIEQARKLEEERREAARKAEEQRLADEQKKAEEQKKREEDEKRRKEAALKKKKEDDEKKRKAAELKKKREDDERKRKEAEAKKKEKSFEEQMREMQALLNKVPDKGAPLPNTPQEEPSKNKGPVLGAKDGRDKQLSASETARLVGLLTRRIQECYRPPVGAAAGLEGLKVRLSFDLNREGSVIGTPRATGVDGAPVSRLAAEAAERAVFGCQPYDMLPADKYDAWKGVDLIFNPKDLFGG